MNFEEYKKCWYASLIKHGCPDKIAQYHTDNMVATVNCDTIDAIKDAPREKVLEAIDKYVSSYLKRSEVTIPLTFEEFKAMCQKLNRDHGCPEEKIEQVSESYYPFYEDIGFEHPEFARGYITGTIRQAISRQASKS